MIVALKRVAAFIAFAVSLVVLLRIAIIPWFPLEWIF